MSDPPTATDVTEIVEWYVLDAIGALPEAQRGEAAARVAAAFGGGGSDWRDTVRAELVLPDDFGELVAAAWHQHRMSVDDAGFDIEPEHFARAFVARSFSEFTSRDTFDEVE